MSPNCLIVAPWKFDLLKTCIFALEASLLEQIFVLRASNFRRRQQLCIKIAGRKGNKMKIGISNRIGHRAIKDYPRLFSKFSQRLRLLVYHIKGKILRKGQLLR